MDGRLVVEPPHDIRDFVLYIMGQANRGGGLGRPKGRLRRTFDRPLGEHQGVQWMLADMHTQLEAARCLTRNCAELYDAGSPDTPVYASMAKQYATDLGMRVTTDCLQLFRSGGFRQRREWMADLSELLTFDEFLRHWAADRPDRHSFR